MIYELLADWGGVVVLSVVVIFLDGGFADTLRKLIP